MPGHQYQLRMDISRKQIACPCTAASYNFPCSHIGAMWIYLRQMEMSIGPRYTSAFETGPLTLPQSGQLIPPDTAS